MIGLVTIFLAAIALMTYLKLTTNQVHMTYRSQTWNSAMAVAEAGLEEALTHCVYNSSNLASQGWALSTGNYQKSNTLFGGAYFVATISTNVPYDIISTGYYPMPGTASYVTRKVKVSTKTMPVFFGALVSKSSVDLNGNKTRVDSYDSRSSAKSTNGKYDIAKAGDKADVVLASIGNLFDLGNGNIWGRAITPPTVTVTTGPNGAVGTAAWNTSSSGIQPGYWIKTANISVPDVTAPFLAATPPATGIVAGVAYDYVLNNGNYMMGTLDKKCAVVGDAILYVTGTINSSVLTIQSNATVKIYCGGATATFNTINNNATAAALQYFGLPANTTFNYGGNWVGGIYTPNADFNITGNNEISGAIVAKSIRMRGNSKFHYDQSLGGTNAPGGFIITSWNEM